MPYLLCPTTQLGRQISSRRPGFSILVIPQANTITYLAIAIRYASLEWTPDFLMVTVYELKVLENETLGERRLDIANNLLVDSVHIDGSSVEMICGNPQSCSVTRNAFDTGVRKMLLQGLIEEHELSASHWFLEISILVTRGWVYPDCIAGAVNRFISHVVCVAGAQVPRSSGQASVASAPPPIVSDSPSLALVQGQILPQHVSKVVLSVEMGKVARARGVQCGGGTAPRLWLKNSHNPVRRGMDGEALQCGANCPTGVRPASTSESELPLGFASNSYDHISLKSNHLQMTWPIEGAFGL
ncbi:hypothetical protein BKA82DRAFT_4011422 [Pisolithus tinctorius]|nr:hypothetical protein BKA82DRAFT_4011422 [Pisolithus tinctorius]